MPRLRRFGHFAAAALFLSACALLPTEVRADTVTLSNVVMTTGSGDANTSRVRLTLGNSDATAQLSLAVGRIGLQNPFDDCLGRCMPGQTMSLTWRAFGSDLGGGPGLLGGLSGNVSIGGGFFTVSAQPILIPTDGADSYTFVVPFSASGSGLALYFNSGSCCRPPDFVLDFSAQGLATVIITRALNGSYLPTSVTYQVAGPVPEPATLLLLGTGLAGAAAGARRKRLLKREG